MRNNSINRLTIDWQAFRTEVFTAAGAAQTIAELQPAIRVANTRYATVTRVSVGHRHDDLRGAAIVRGCAAGDADHAVEHRDRARHEFGGGGHPPRPLPAISRTRSRCRS